MFKKKIKNLLVKDLMQDLVSKRDISVAERIKGHLSRGIFTTQMRELDNLLERRLENRGIASTSVVQIVASTSVGFTFDGPPFDPGLRRLWEQQMKGVR